MNATNQSPFRDWHGLEFARFAVNSLSKSKTPAMFCQLMVHEVFVGTGARAAMVGEANNKGQVDLFGSYGYENAQVIRERLAIWDDRAICKSIRENSKVTIKNLDQYRAMFPNAQNLGLPGDGYLAVPFGREWGRFCAFGVAFEGELPPEVAESSPALAFLGSLASLILFRTPKVDVFDWEAGDKAGLLTKRQLQIVEMVADGDTNPEIAAKLHVSESLVKQELGKCLRLLDVTNRHELSRRAVDLGIATLGIG